MSNTRGRYPQDNQPPQSHLDEDLRVQAVADAVGALSERDRHILEHQESIADPEVRRAIWEAREGVMKQIRTDLPEIEPDPSLKHRVMARVLGAIEKDLTGSTEGPDPTLPMPEVVKRNWIERFVGGRVSPVWRVAALVLMTVSIALFWNLTAAMHQNNELLAIARDNDAEHFVELVGPSSAEFLLNPLAQHVAFDSIDPEADEALALVCYFPGEADALFLTTGLPTLENGQYYLKIEAPGVDSIVISFSPKGQITGMDFSIPNGVDPAVATWWVLKMDDQDEEVKVMANLS